ncbi:chloramphenicol phosphotransferase CPT family protein [Bacillus pinisoli]|uniref:chloramphenicol phosphotransferase CPT family protein n=1 Tax=Bacillus pinisoli TaxID=2901866 RepID=UPI001FF66F1A|nr:AAA family ATPase [Bacillus pinisoli]
MTLGKIILLNGVSSSGKSTLSKALAERLKDYFHFSIDEFDYVVETMEERGVEKGRLIPVPTEYLFHDNIRIFSNYGVNLIVDQIFIDKETMEDFFKKLHDYPILFIGVHCSVVELERREKQRGDRPIGQAKSQLQFFHQHNEVYDLQVNTEVEPIEDCVNKIISLLEDRI